MKKTNRGTWCQKCWRERGLYLSASQSARELKAGDENTAISPSYLWSILLSPSAEQQLRTEREISLASHPQSCKCLTAKAKLRLPSLQRRLLSPRALVMPSGGTTTWSSREKFSFTRGVCGLCKCTVSLRKYSTFLKVYLSVKWACVTFVFPWCVDIGVYGSHVREVTYQPACLKLLATHKLQICEISSAL